jgi:hypothetical protein
MTVVGTHGRYQASARGVATAATADHCAAMLWNPHATKDIVCTFVAITRLSATNSYYLARATTRGTEGSVITPDIDNDSDLLLAPKSGALILRAPWSVQPTLQTPAKERFMVMQVNTAYLEKRLRGVMGDGVRIPAGNGLAIVQTDATIADIDATFHWDE